jgi:hypothetical protein
VSSGSFTNAQMQAAAAAAGPAAQTGFGAQIQAYQAAQRGSAVAPVQPATPGQQAAAVASAAQIAWLQKLGGSTLAAMSIGAGAGAGGSPPNSSVPTISQVSSYLSGLLAAGSGGTTTPAAPIKTAMSVQDAKAQLSWLNSQGSAANLSAFRVAPGSVPPSSWPQISQIKTYLQGVIAAGGSGSSSGSTLSVADAQAQLAWLNSQGSTVNLYANLFAQSTAGSATGPSLADIKAYLQSIIAGGGSGSGSSGSKGPTSKGSSGSTSSGSKGSTNVTQITADEAYGIESTYPATTLKRPLGDITTLLDLTNRDLQENDLFPLKSEITWFTRDTERRVLAFSPTLQEIPLRGPGAFGQRFSFDLGSILVGDIMLGTALQIRLDHWLDPQTQLLYETGRLTYTQPALAWEYANSLGTSIIQQAELEIDGKTMETIDGDFIHTFSTLYPEYNTQVGIAYDHLGRISIPRLVNQQRAPRLYPTEDGILNCILPFFYMRTKMQSGLPMTAAREGIVKIHITLRPFQECVRQMRGFRDTCTSTPLDTSFALTSKSSNWAYDSTLRTGTWDIVPRMNLTYVQGTSIRRWNYSAVTGRGSWDNQPPLNLTYATTSTWSGTAWSPSVPSFDFTYTNPADGAAYAWTAATATWSPSRPTFSFQYGTNLIESSIGNWSYASPPLRSVQLLTYGAIVQGEFRQRMLRQPFELMHREVQTFYFDEPLKYAIGKRNEADTIRIQLPLEANHPMEEIIWFVRRKGVSDNNAWTNFTSVMESEWNAAKAEQPLLQNAILQANGVTICDADEQYYRQLIARSHRGGMAAYSSFVYGYPFARLPGEHQPSGTFNASRVNSLRLTLDVKPPGGVLDANWEVKVFCIAINWLRFENGIANPMFED